MRHPLGLKVVRSPNYRPIDDRGSRLLKEKKEKEKRKSRVLG